MDLEPSGAVVEMRRRISDFVRTSVIPREPELFRGCDDAARVELQTAAKAAGVFAPQLPTHLGGGGFDLTSSALLLEAAGHSLLGPLALNCAAPDEGNLNMLEQVASPDQKERYLAPLATGDQRSCFAMTEPAPGVGSDPRAVRTKAVRTSGGWLLSGRKHFITGGDGADFAIVMAVTGEQRGEGVTMFLLPTSSEGWVLTGHYGTLDAVGVGGHCSFDLHEAFVPDEDVLGKPGQGLRYAQVRLAPARLTHCMRWLGAAGRTHEIALSRAVDREVFGRPLTEQGMAQALIADNEIDLAASRALLLQACWDVQHERDPGVASSRAKVFISEAVGRITDRSVQLMGGLGTVHADGPDDAAWDGAVARTYADIRAFRIYDGASEVHRMSIARRAAKRVRVTGPGVQGHA